MVECDGVVMFGVPIVTHSIACDVLNLLWIIVILHVPKGNIFFVPVCTCGTTHVDYSAPILLSGLFFRFYASGAYRARSTCQSSDKHLTHSGRAQYYLECVFWFIVTLLAAE